MAPSGLLLPSFADKGLSRGTAPDFSSAPFSALRLVFCLGMDALMVSNLILPGEEPFRVFSALAKDLGEIGVSECGVGELGDVSLRPRGPGPVVPPECKRALGEVSRGDSASSIAIAGMEALCARGSSLGLE